MSDGVSPSDAVAEIEATANGEAETSTASEAAADGEASEPSPSTDDGTSLSDVLLSTEPDLSVTQQADALGVDESVSHAYVGVRKALAAVGVGDGEATEGTPAIVNFGAALGFFGFGDAGDAGDSSDTEALETVEVPGGGRSV